GWDLDDYDILFIENVGNLVCPAIYDLGQHLNVVAMSVTEGEDKPLKYPVMFRAADLVVLTKSDLLPHLEDVDPVRVRNALAHVMPDPRMIVLSSRDGQGMDLWGDWLQLHHGDLLRFRSDRERDPSGDGRVVHEGDSNERGQTRAVHAWRSGHG
ncbi:MAG TPA: hydrogenase nickel incorporation protein HypB, partial [Myxococcota bacterium]|nr:hydrogenase nickel incorporation protein HypB [Myxococcota bacterium]